MNADEIFALLLGYERDAEVGLSVITRQAALTTKGAETEALAKAIGANVVARRSVVRTAAANEGSFAPSGVSDAERGEKAGAYVANAWLDGAPETAAERALEAVAVVASYEIFDAWNDEIGRAIEALVLADDASSKRGQWATQRDKVVCSDCKKLDRKLSGSDGKFDLPGGARGRPPLHKHCRCFVVIAEKSDEGEGAKAMFEGREVVREIIGSDGAGGALIMRGSIREETREVDFVASTAREDSYGDVIDQSSWQLADYINNPIVLYGHQSRELPIGRASNVGVRNGQLECTIRLASAEANPEAEKVWRLIKEGVLKTVSVGFLPVDGRYETIAGREVFVWRSPILKEISVVPVPANPDALAKTKSAFAAKHAGTIYANKPNAKHELKSGETFVTDKSGARMELRADGSIEINTITPAASPATPNNPSGGATKKESSMDLAEALKIIETKSTEIGTLTASSGVLEKQLAAANAEKSALETQLVDVRGKLATLETEKSALTTQNAALVVERDAAITKVAEGEAKLAESEVDALVGVKITPAEKDAYLKLRKTSPDLFKEMIGQRADLGLLGKSITGEGNHGKKGAPKPAGTATADAASEVFGE